ncbi:hypothetical protein T06_14538, partial [Trichinella sp. T6]
LTSHPASGAAAGVVGAGLGAGLALFQRRRVF